MRAQFTSYRDECVTLKNGGYKVPRRLLRARMRTNHIMQHTSDPRGAVSTPVAAEFTLRTSARHRGRQPALANYHLTRASAATAAGAGDMGCSVPGGGGVAFAAAAAISPLWGVGGGHSGRGAAGPVNCGPRGFPSQAARYEPTGPETAVEPAAAPLGAVPEAESAAGSGSGAAPLEPLGPAWQALHAVALVSLALAGSAANVLVLAVFYRRPALRSPSNRFVLSLVVSNLLGALVVAPALLVQLLRPAHWLRHVCAGLTTLAVTASIFSIVAIAVDRYSAVLSPLHYAMTITRRRARGMIVAAWAGAALLAAPPVLGPRPVGPGAPPLGCGPSARSHAFRLAYALALFAAGFALPLCALCWIYARMYKAAHRNSERTRRHSVSTNPGELVGSGGGSRGGSLDLPQPPQPQPQHAGDARKEEGCRRPGKNPPLSQTKRRCSNASLSTLLFREEGRAVKTAAMVVASFLLCWTLFFATVLADAWAATWQGADDDDDEAEAEGPGSVPEQCRRLAELLALSSGCVTPAIYVFRNEAARAEALRLLLWWRPLAAAAAAAAASATAAVHRVGEPCAIKAGTGATLGSSQEGYTLRRQSLSFCDSISVQSFQIPASAAASGECRHCTEALHATADFIATYEVIESPGDEIEDRKSATPSGRADVRGGRSRRESVTFRLAFLPARRCQACVRQNSDSSSGSGHPLLRDGPGGTVAAETDPPALAVASSASSAAAQRRQRLRLARAGTGSSGDEFTGSDVDTPRHAALLGPGATDAGAADLIEMGDHTAATALQLYRPLPRSAPTFFQETSLEHALAIPAASVVVASPPPSARSASSGVPADWRQDSGSSAGGSAVRQDSARSDVTVDSGVVADALLRSHSSSSSLSLSGAEPPVARRHKLQRLAAVEDEDSPILVDTQGGSGRDNDLMSKSLLKSDYT
ncbi:uncharacterized protein LOC126247724 [Schistocerca nitens]|uniref:uncharacterized protein LOC126247724 n=1 Tax=Schistocerca nitens TaxID=7011 RepID=UPI002117ED94|nr:uncharacterized protein LOC126247724 [Schistocerca nitens]